MKKLSTLLLSAILLMVTGSTAMALTFQGAENLVLDKVIDDDGYFSGGSATLDSDINGDLYIAGGDVDISGNVAEDLVVLGGRVTVTGNVGDDIRVVGGDVIVSGNVGDDLIAFGGNVTIAKNAVVNGTVAAGAGYLKIDGQVKEDVTGGAGMIFLRGTVDGDVTVIIEEKLEVRPEAKINGDLKYSAIVPMDIPDGVVAGDTEFNKFETAEKDLNKVTSFYVIYRAISYLASLLLLLLLVWGAPRGLMRAAEEMKKSPLKTFGIGLLTLIGGFLGAIILMVTVIGLPLGVIILLMLIASFYFAKLFASVWLAAYLINFAKKKKYQRLILFGATAAALLFYYLIGLVPYVGWLISAVLFLIGLGGIVITKKYFWEYLRAKKQI